MHTLALLITSLGLSVATIAPAVLPQQPDPTPQQQNPQQPKPAPATQNPAPKPAEAPKQEPKPGEAAKQEPKPGEAAKPGAQDKAKDKDAKTFPPEKLEQLVAPIALYPDGLLSQTLMAATYPLEIVQAARWVAKNPTLKGDALEKALQDQSWDPAVKALCGLPEILKKMDANLDWTQDLGDAFLADQSALMDTVQRMRQKAKDSGNLESSKEQKVTQKEDKIIIIESADPQTVYVPTYYPTAVYGGWAYPYYYYPPMYPAYPPGYPAFTFAVGVAWGAAIWGGCHWGWGHSECNINVNNFNNFTNRTENNFNRDRVQQHGRGSGTAGSGNRWNHDASHRQGVRYGDKGTASRFNQASTADRAARGYGQNRAGTQPSAGTRPSTGGATQRPSTGGATQRPSTGGATQRPSTGTTNRTTQSAGQRSGSFSGAKSPSTDRAASQRGSTSRGTTSRSSGGASRGGGGRSGGGGRGGGGRR